MDPTTPTDEAYQAIEVLAVVVAVVTVFFVIFAVLLLRAGRLQHPGPLIVSLSMLTAVALVLGIVRTSEAAIAIAGTGVGALAAALAAVYKDNGPKNPPKEDKDEPTA